MPRLLVSKSFCVLCKSDLLWQVLSLPYVAIPVPPFQRKRIAGRIGGQGKELDDVGGAILINDCYEEVAVFNMEFPVWGGEINADLGSKEPHPW